jgi:hypothetical protein
MYPRRIKCNCDKGVSAAIARLFDLQDIGVGLPPARGIWVTFSVVVNLLSSFEQRFPELKRAASIFIDKSV